MMKRMACLGAAVLFTVSACASPAAQTGVAAAAIALTAADQAAVAYITLPACPSKNGTLCSDAVKVAQIKSAGALAFAAVKAAEAGTGTQANAQAALATFVALVPIAPK